VRYPEDFINKIICGDCLEVMKEMPNECVDLVVTSPPYNLGIDYGSYKDNLSWVEYYDWSQQWMKELFRILKNDGRICINHYLSFGTSKFRTAPLMEINSIALSFGFKHHSVVIWEDITIKKHSAWGSWLSASAPYINSPYEGILILYKKYWKKQTIGITDIDKKTFIRLCRGRWDIPTEHKTLTKCMFPEKLPDYCIRLLSYENDLILDLFTGSGTTALVCKRLHRNFIGIEINPEYCKIAEDRLRQGVL